VIERKKELRKRYRLVQVTTTERDINEIVHELTSKVEYIYGRYRSVEDSEFDSEDEAIKHALSSEDWLYRDFTILPIYSILVEY
jgi:hypothetical protein